MSVGWGNLEKVGGMGEVIEKVALYHVHTGIRQISVCMICLIVVVL